jgi:tetratricopeptide (TPR) repeat protein
MFDVFISYRRGESRGDAGRLCDRLAVHFGPEHVFMDIDDVGPGQDFALALQKALEHCGALIVLIGPEWAGVQDEEGSRRLDDPNDFVRLEIQAGLAKGSRVIPVLVGGARMPQPSELPPELSGLSRHQAHEITHQRFHADVDRLIEAVEESVGSGWHGLKIPRRLGRALLVIAGVAIPIGLYLGATSFQAARTTRAQVRTHLDAGDRFFSQEEYAPAMTEYVMALEVDPDDVRSARRLVSATTQQLLMEAFGPGASYDLGLGGNYERARLVSDSAIDEARSLIYRLKSIDPELRDDVGLLLDEALILKTNGSRVLGGIPLLEEALDLSPTDPEVIAELGLLKAVLRGEPEGVELVRRASNMDPDRARYHYYLGRSLGETHLCSRVSGPTPGAPIACAEAVREYRLAGDLAITDDVWAREIRAGSVSRGWEIFHAYARRGHENPTDTIGLSVDERIEEIEYLSSVGRSTSHVGWWDWPGLWLVTLYEAQGDSVKAATLMREFMSGRSFESSPLDWWRIYARVLRASGGDPEMLREVEDWIERRER